MYIQIALLALTTTRISPFSTPFSSSRILSYSSNEDRPKKYPISRPISSYHPSNSEKNNKNNNMISDIRFRKYPLTGRNFYERLQKLNSKNETLRDEEMLKDDNTEWEDGLPDFSKSDDRNNSNPNQPPPHIRIIFGNGIGFGGGDDNDDDPRQSMGVGPRGGWGNKKNSQNFEVITDYPISFKDVGGFDNIKTELSQCVEFLRHYQKYSNYNVRVPKGLILEGPPGNGKTLLAKAMAGECKASFIAVSGSEFQEKYVGVGSSKVRELFKLASENVPCIVFIDEIDACGRKRGGDGDGASQERDNTLNELLIALDGFKNTTGVFLVGATNRADLLDPALMRPGRIDKRVYIAPPDAPTREAIIRIHKQGKPHDSSIVTADLVDITMGLTGAQIENLLNEAMLNALRNNKTQMSMQDVDMIMNRIIAGWQPTEHSFSPDLIDQIAIHEMGHAIAGLASLNHAKMTKVIINLSSPQSPGYTVFEGSTNSLYTREALFEHLTILLAGRMAEEMFYTTSVTTGAINDFEEAFKLSEKMIIYYGMGKELIYPQLSEKYKEMIDTEVANLISEAYTASFNILNACKPLIIECADILKRDKLLKREALIALIKEKYMDIVPDILKELTE